jgi:elongation factor G
MALKEAAKKCSPVLLEPIMALEITVPEQYYGDVIGDIIRRRGNVTGESQRANAKTIEAEVPLCEMFGYVTDLRSMTQGRGNYVMQFDHYGECPRYIQDEIIKKSGVNNR